ncbi:TM0106 family RecB-like putative nuclease [Microbacterium sp.]|uniref:TM0106 family RecB-like putative nuclease n=1 Tax=Microbacterium sp. TaxID=51671 RepID=UPI0039E35A1E
MRYIEGEGEGEGRVVWSASDLKAAAECEFAWLRRLDAKLGRIAAVEDPEDLTRERAGRLGTQHELRTLAAYRERFPGRVVEIPATRSTDAAALAAAVAQTNAALASDAAVIYQAAFAAEEFVGFADFLVREDAADAVSVAGPAALVREYVVDPAMLTHEDAAGTAGPARWIVQDTKLARHARVTALMQLAAYVDQLDLLGVPRSDRVELLLGDGSVSAHAIRDILPVFGLRRARLRALIADRRIADGAAGAPIPWGDERGSLRVVACGRCPTCDAEVVAHRDLLLVAGMRPVQRERLRAAGIDTIDALAAATELPARMAADTFAQLRTQARLQLTSPAGGVAPLTAPTDLAAADATRIGPAEPAPAAPADVAVPTYEVVLPAALAALPRPDHGDLFFDFEGDPLHTEGAGRSGATQWGIDYLFGWVDTREQYSALWAHTLADEKAALERFLDLVALRRQRHPGMHIYHYAPYEPTHLLAMAARHGVREADVDRLLRDGVFVDLYPIVRRALRVGSRSYSIKKLEPLYMGAEVRTSDVQRGDDSIVKYVEARVYAEAGDEASAQEILDDLADYNRYDCVSTRRLRDWLVERAREAGLHPSADPEPDENGYAPSPRAEALARLAADAVDDPVAEALRLGAAAIDYYPREAKTYWAAHFLRLREPVSIWAQTRDVIVVDAGRSRVLTPWHRPERARVDRRVVELHGDLAPGTKLSADSGVYALYAMPAPFPAETHPRWIHVARPVKIVDVLDDGVVIEENATPGAAAWSTFPVALTPGAPPRAGSQQTAIDEWADAVIQASPSFPADPATDLLLRLRPRTGTGTLARTAAAVRDPDRSDIDDIVRTLADLDRSYLAVQGPPGTGKTYVGSHVVARLVRERGFKIGVVAQSHNVVEHMLDGIVAAGVPKELVAKAIRGTPTGAESFTVIAKDGMAAFTAAHPGGYVVGGTAWDLTHPARIPRQSLDLLVIDEAGQFSLASTIAVSVAAPRLLLLGDPQQLPQVSQGTHPEPVDTSALGWVMDSAAVIAADRGYFLAQTRRMRPEVAVPVSQLSYEGRLEAHPCTSERLLGGVEAGVVPVPLSHTGNATQSSEEATVVVGLVRDLVGRPWHDGTATRPLQPADLIVVTPYNAQQVEVEEALAAAGFPEVPVGTVDRFQGQEAAVSIVSLAASSGRDAPRGLEFLLLQNRLNVAVSRAQHTAYVVYSTGLLDDLPRTPEGVARLSAFARLVGAA